MKLLDRYVIRTNFNGTVQETHEFTNDQIDFPENLRILRALCLHRHFERHRSQAVLGTRRKDAL